jgi:hypothetical protein
MTYQVGAINQYEEHDMVLVPKWCLSDSRQMNADKTNSGGFNASKLYSWLQNEYYAMLPQEVRELIVETTQITSIGSTSTNIQNTIGKIFLPTEYEVFGATYYAADTEHTIGGSTQFEIFVNSTNRIKIQGKRGASVRWWLCSPFAKYTYVFCCVQPDGIDHPANAYGNANDYCGILPCLRLKAQK